jgi:acetyl esterase/lipase
LCDGHIGRFVEAGRCATLASPFGYAESVPPAVRKADSRQSFGQGSYLHQNELIAEHKLLFRIVVAVLVAVLGRIVRRLVRGPIVVTWSWNTELTVASMRAGIDTALRDPDVAALRRLEARIDPPLPKRLRRSVRFTPTTLGGRPVECLTRRGNLDRAGELLYFHGGGYVGGSPATHRRFVAALVQETRTRAWVPDYRLAPEHPFPAAVDDAQAAYEALLRDGIDPQRVLLGGDSAGGGLAMALLLRIRSTGGPLPAGAVLFSPYIDLEHTGESPVRNEATDYLPPIERGRANTTYLGNADPRTPEASPLYGNLTGFPPLLVFAGDREAILDDATRFVRRALECDVSAVLHIGEDMPHVWPAVLPDQAASLLALGRVADWTASILRPAPPASHG